IGDEAGVIERCDTPPVLRDESVFHRGDFCTGSMAPKPISYRRPIMGCDKPHKIEMGIIELVLGVPHHFQAASVHVNNSPALVDEDHIGRTHSQGSKYLLA